MSNPFGLNKYKIKCLAAEFSCCVSAKSEKQAWSKYCAAFAKCALKPDKADYEITIEKIKEPAVVIQKIDGKILFRLANTIDRFGGGKHYFQTREGFSVCL